jgi:hypothetical protein
LLELDPGWMDAGGAGIMDRDGRPAPPRHGIGLSFTCPCCGAWRYVPFSNPLDGGPPHQPDHALWHRTGETFETLTLTPSVLSAVEKGGCGWHGFITNGEVHT